ncbi:bifunctional methylenetetrahydrofolate dehydrogenase/methenyltetrahydrofolate cyclohydrolase FolD [Candidatus Riflebacteria bacterium]
MPAKILYGKQIAEEIRAELGLRIEQLKDRGITPGLGVICVGSDPASKSYVKAKEKACKKIGIYSKDIPLQETTSQEELLRIINELNSDAAIHGILVQLPLPKHIQESEVLRAIDPEKDVDGFHPINVGKMLLGEESLLPCTPHGILQLLIRNGVELKGANIVILGRSNIVGKPLAGMLMQKAETGNATVTVCHTSTRDIYNHTLKADIVICATGRPDTLKADMVKPGVIVIDVGVNRVEDPAKKKGYRLVGDVDYEAVSEKAAMITPVPGGVGPMTITMLLYNTVESAGHFLNKEH